MTLNRIFKTMLYGGLAYCCCCATQSVNAQIQPSNDSITVAIEPSYNNVSNFHRFWLGENYRRLWAIPVRLKVLHLDSEKGGLSIVKQGGGLQTKSLRLRDTTGHEWVLRTIQKFPERGLPVNLRKTVTQDILQDQVSTGHPYAALTVPPLTEALGIPHANPQIVYLPDDPALGEYRKDMAKAVFLFEEREPLNHSGTDNTTKVQKEVQDDNDTRIDETIVLRARLLDLLLGDWDRHEDQWRWEKDKKKKEKTYTPVPRDRDQVYYNTSGVFPWIVSHQWLKTKFQGFHENIRDINGFNFNARYFDRYFLNQLGEDEWKQQVAYVQQTLTDSLLELAVRLMPDTIYALSGKEIVGKLITRRNNLLPLALNYYRFLSKTVEIPASDKQEQFNIAHTTNGQISVTVYKIKKDGTKDKVIYQRTFQPDVTREIRLYGFAGNDVFSVYGTNHSSIRVRMIGGADEDSFHIDPNLHQRGKLYVYDRSDSANILPPRSEARVKVSTDSNVNAYDKQSFQYDRFEPIILGTYSLDQGIQFRTGFSYERHGFRKEPYAYRHELLIDYSFARKSFLITYAGRVKKLFGKNDLDINVYSKAPKNTSNFFGIGNETIFPNKDNREISYYRSRYDFISADVTIGRTFAHNFRANAGIGGQYYNANGSNNTHKFLNEYNLQYPQNNVFSTQFYAGLVASLDYDTRDNSSMPIKGMYWHTSLTGMKALSNHSGATYGQVLSEYSFYLSPKNDHPRFTLAERFGGGTTVGDPAYFQWMHLGGMSNLRGFHTFRFAGKSMLYNNTELRLKLFDFNSYLFPGTIGLIAFNDIGRVWQPGESSAKWHDGYGGGLYIIPAELVLLQVVVGASKENVLTYLAIGFRF